VKSEAVSTESLKEIVVVDPLNVMDSAPERTAPETFNKAPATTELDPETDSPPTLVNVTEVGALAVVMLTDADVYPASVAIEATAAASVETVTGTAATRME
jgi:hypothetical protein